MGFWNLVGMTLGIAVLVRIIYKFLPDTDIDLKKLGAWAVVTGATEGIGKAFSHELAKKGFNIVLMSSDFLGIREAADVIEQSFGVMAKTMPANFAYDDEVMYAMVRDELQHLDIGVLVNNVGIDCSHPEYFLELGIAHPSLYNGILYSNIWAVVNMTRIVLPGMVQKKKGLIINMSSLLCEIPAPLDTLYAASKAFVTKFSKDLDLEYREKGVHIHVLNTGPVETEMIRMMTEAPGGISPAVSPQSYAKSALVSATKMRVSTGHVMHTFEQTVARWMNPWLLNKIMLKLMETQKALLGAVCEQCLLEVRPLNDDQ